ncbi:IS200/IS605 family element transposase accessory protein TnpB [Candidatus Poribacteria bacterium]|nr:IS200/IS605 family element transposase accessory protein TnpB [Candidatus Poribacteria bacterium]MYG07274.1 IS200/IS605 family element transposase accessory protein TnpB [Candidatus Poribacteria bacterium]MYK21647.1 IS200/IS605 family element transposase accessory protein TnpB [Candidatus Poribacteria bacterium]
MKLTFRYPVYPTKTQQTTLLKWLDHLCDLQNSARHDRLVAHETEGAFVALTDQQQLLTAAREKYDDFREVPQDFQNHALRRNDKAFANFRRRCKNGAAKKGYPRYKKRVRSLTWSLRKYSKVVAKKTGDTDKQTIRVRQNPIRETGWKHDRLKVPELGEVKIYMHRRLQGDPKEVTLVKKASGWYAHISCELPDTPKVEPTAAIAVDMGTTHYLTTSEGEKEGNPRWYRQAEGLTRKHSKNLSRKKLGSHRRKKQQHKLALHHERTTNRRKDFIGKLVYKLYHHEKNNVLVAENLSTSNMVKNKHLSKSISDASWATFFKWCGNIAERDGFHFHQVDPKNTSQTCSSCGQKSVKKLSLAIRTFRCQFCGTALDRDHNAAINILFRAAAALRGERWVATLYEARNKNEARDKGLQNATQLTLFDATASPSL